MMPYFITAKPVDIACGKNSPGIGFLGGIFHSWDAAFGRYNYLRAPVCRENRHSSDVSATFSKGQRKVYETRY